MARLTICHPVCTDPPEQFINPPELNEASVTPAKHDQIVHPLHAPAFFWCVRGGQHGGGSDEAKVPANAQQDQRDKEILKLNTHHRHSPGSGKDHQPKGHHLLGAVTGDEMARKERWRIHGQHMRRHHIGGVRCFKPASHHRKRRGCHHKVHQRIADCGADHCHRDAGRAQKLHPAAAFRGTKHRGFRLGDVQHGKQEHAHKIQRDHRQIGAKEGHDHALRRGLDQLRPEHRRQQPTRHHIGNRLGPKQIRGGIGGGKAVKTLGRHIGAGEQCPQHENRERGVHQSIGPDRRPDHAKDRPDHKAHAPPVTLHDRRQAAWPTASTRSPSS